MKFVTCLRCPKPLLLGFAAAVLAGGCAVLGGEAADPEPLSVFVVVDEASTSTLGAFPLDRRIYARAITKAKEAGARGLALKFFFDRPSTPEADAAVAAAQLELPVLMQIFPGQSKETTVSEKLARPDWDVGSITRPLKIASVAYPIGEMRQRAQALGFVEVRKEGIADHIETVALVGNVPVASLQLEIVELGLGEKATIRDRRLRLGKKTYPLDDLGRVVCPSFEGPSPRVYGIDALLTGTIPAEHIRGKVVVLGYGRRNSPTVDVSGAAMPVHTAFYRQVACLSRLAVGT